MSFRKSALVATCCVTLLLWASPSPAAQTIQKSFDVGAGGSLVIEADTGSIIVKTSSRGIVDVTVERSGDHADDLDVQFEHSGDTVRVRAELPKMKRWGRGPKVKFLVSIPRTFNVDLDTAGGSIQVDDLDGDVTVETSGGSLKLGRIDGTVSGHTSGGSITLDGSTQAANLTTSGGSVNVGDVGADLKVRSSGGSITIGAVLGEVDVHTSGGSITVGEARGTISATSSGGSVSATIAGQPSARSTLKTSGGSVNVAIASHLALDISASCSGGKVYSDLQLGSQERSKRSLRGQLNGGGPELVLHTSGGSVHIERD